MRGRARRRERKVLIRWVVEMMQHNQPCEMPFSSPSGPYPSTGLDTAGDQHDTRC